MRSLFYVLSALAVIGLAYWAYSENYRTQSAQSDVRALKRDIASLREALSVQRAEWAYLNRPERLRDLADLNFDSLGLMPMRPDQFGLIEQITYPTPAVSEAILPQIRGAVPLTALFDENTPGQSARKPEAAR